MKSGSRAALLIIFLTVFIDLLGFGIVLPLLPRYAKHFGLSGFNIGMLMASFSAMQFLFAPIWGRRSDRIGRRPILLMGLASSCISYAIFGYASSLGANSLLLGIGVIPWLYISRIAAGIAGATISTAQAYIADITGPAQRARGMALIGSAFGLGFTFGPLIGAAFLPGEAGDAAAAMATAASSTVATTAASLADAVEPAPSGMPGYIASVLSGIAFLGAVFFLPESLAQTGDAAAKSRAHRSHFDFGALRSAASRAGILPILLTVFITTFAFAQFESTLSLLTKAKAMNDRDNYLIFAYIGLILAVSQGGLIRPLIPRLGEFVMSTLGTCLMTVGLLGIAGVAQYGGVRELMLVLPICVVGFSMLNPSLQGMLSRLTSEDDQGGVLGLSQSMSALARILGPVVGLSLKDVSILAPYLAASGVMLLGVMLSISLWRFRGQLSQQLTQSNTTAAGH